MTPGCRAESRGIRWGFTAFELPYLTAMFNADNERSIRVAKRLGFAPLREDELLGDPVVVYWLSQTPG